MNDAQWFAEHRAYLATPDWAVRRSQVLNRDVHRCQACLSGCSGEATQVHHLTYKHWRNEPLFDLVSVCVHCHDLITEMDRENRPPAPRLKRKTMADVVLNMGNTSIWNRAPW